MDKPTMLPVDFAEGNVIRYGKAAGQAVPLCAFFRRSVQCSGRVMAGVIVPMLLAAAITPSVQARQGEPLANAGLEGIYARNIRHVLRMDPSHVDLATAALLASGQWDGDVQIRRYLSMLDEMAMELRDRIRAGGLEGRPRAIQVINDYLFAEMKFGAVAEANDPNDLFLHTVLDRRKGHCLSLSILYLSIGERLGLPLYGVVVPEHFFVRYNDGKVRFNIETTSGGNTAPDEHYIRKFNVPPGESIYMDSLDKIRTLGCFLNNLGNAYSQVGDIRSATETLENAVNINPSLVESRTNLGNAYLQAGRTDKAIFQYRSALEINPAIAAAHRNLAGAYLKAGRFHEAITEYQRALDIEPGAETYKALSSAYAGSGRYGEAINMLDQALRLEGENATIRFRLGNVHYEMGNYQKALLHYKRAVTIDAGHADSHYGMGLCYNKMDLVDREIRAYKRALAANPDMVSATMNLGNAYFTKGLYGQAAEYYSQAAEFSPDDPRIFNNLGAANVNMERYDLAAEAYLRGLAIEPQSPQAHRQLAFVLYKLGRFEKAGEHAGIAEDLGMPVDAELQKAIEEKLR